MNDIPVKKSLYSKLDDGDKLNEHLRAVDRDIENICLFSSDMSRRIGGVGELDGGAVNTVFLAVQNSDGGGA